MKSAGLFKNRLTKTFQFLRIVFEFTKQRPWNRRQWLSAIVDVKIYFKKLHHSGRRH